MKHLCDFCVINLSNLLEHEAHRASIIIGYFPSKRASMCVWVGEEGRRGVDVEWPRARCCERTIGSVLGHHPNANKILI